MTNTESAIHEFIVSEILKGQGDGLDLNTELFDLNILDSFGIMTVLAFIEEKLGVMIPPEDLSKDAFRSIESIAALVEQKKHE